MYALTAHITIGQVVMNAVHAVHIKKSIHSYVDMATIQIPASCRLKVPALKINTPSVQTAKVIQEGDKVTIELGYDGQNRVEFVGFVKRVNFTHPVEIECEGYSWQLRGLVNTLKNKSWKGEIDVKTILQYVLQGTDITLHPDSPQTVLTTTAHGFALNNVTGKEALEKIKQTTGLALYMVGSQLYVGTLLTAQVDSKVVYNLGYNTIEDGQLRYRTPEDVKTKIRVNYRNSAGKSVHKMFGDQSKDALEKVVERGVVTNLQQLEQDGRLELAKTRYPGYEGELTTFIQPYAQPGWAAEVRDDRYPERGGTFVIDCVTVKYGKEGARRIVGIGYNLNAGA